jgi:hypothetical protein
VRTTQYLLRAQRIEIDPESAWITLVDDIVLQGETYEATGQRILVNYETGAWRLAAPGFATIEPEFFEGGQVAEPLLLSVEGGQAPSESGPLRLQHARLTSCDWDRLHYHLASSEIEVRPGRKVIARRPSFYLFGNKVLQLPFDLVLPLDRRTEYLPELGQNNVEGYYAKFAFAYLLSEAADGLFRLNLTSKRGVGVGVEQYLATEDQEGVGSVMFEPSEGSLVSRLTHRYQISDQWRSDVTASYQDNSGFFGNTSNFSGTAQFTRRSAQGNTQVAFRRSSSTSTYSTNNQFTTSLYQQQRFGDTGSWSLRGTWNDLDYGEFNFREDLDLRFDVQQRTPSFDWRVESSQLYELDKPEGSSPRYALNRLPAATLTTSSRRLGDYRLLGKVPFDLRVELGQYEQQPADFSVFRSAWDLRLGGTSDRWSRTLEARTSANYRQAFFSDGSARYILGGNADLRHDMGGGWQQQLRYAYQDTDGFAPLSLDYAGRSHSLNYRLVNRVADRSWIDLSTGYDLIDSFWQDLRLRSEYMPNRHNKLSLQGGWDIELDESLPWGLVWTHVDRPHLYAVLAGEYDPRGTGLTRASAELDWRLSEQWELGLISSYSGYSERLDTLDVQLVKDLHCMTASLTYSKERDEILFNIAIKAFPTPENVLGIGRSGQQFQALPGQFF